MTVRGDLEAIVSQEKPAEERVKDIFAWLTCADVVVFLESNEQNLLPYFDAIDLLKQKCAA